MVAVEALKQRLSGLDDEALDELFGQSLITTTDWTRRELETLIALAAAFEALDRRHIRTPLLAQELAYALFLADDARARAVWAGAAARLGMSAVAALAPAQDAPGEPAIELGALLGINAHALAVRSPHHPGGGTPFMRDLLRGIEEYLKATHDPRQVPLVNLQCDQDDPIRALGDLVWMRDALGPDLGGRRVALTWVPALSPLEPQATAQALITLLPRFGADVVLAHPEGHELAPTALEAARRAAAEGAHAVYPITWAPRELLRERHTVSESGDAGALQELERRALAQSAHHPDWRCDEERMRLTADALYLHGLPGDRGGAVAPSIRERSRVQVARQANKQVYVLMAVLAAAKVRGLWGRLQRLLD
jgi:ornithine carbamoyltransferase